LDTWRFLTLKMNVFVHSIPSISVLIFSVFVLMIISLLLKIEYYAMKNEMQRKVPRVAPIAKFVIFF
jgi:uncharacterized membrane protein